jgi:hypothetical protein
MKITAFLLFLFSFNINIQAQTNPAADCSNLLKIVALANTRQLKTVEAAAFSSKYFKPLFGDKIYASKISMPGVLESFIDDDPEDGCSYEAFIKDYGTDAAAAQADFALQTKKYEACFKTDDITHSDVLTTYIYFKDCKIELHTYKHSSTNTWVCRINVRNNKEE